MNYMLDKVNEYLVKESDYAVQITGNWGYGKTHYYRTVLEPFICEKQTHANAAKKYKAVYVSLFGLKTIDDIATKIVMDFYQSALFKGYFRSSHNNKKLKITQNVLKIALRGFIGFNKLGNVNEYLTDIKQIADKALDTSELVVCFDDLERRDSCLSLEDFTGYINSMVDEGIKVLIISNDDLLIKLGDSYKNLIEKIIGIKVEYAPEIDYVISDIIASRYSGFEIFRNYLTKNKSLLNEFALAVNKNFRHVIYVLENFHHCYSLIKKGILDSKHEIYEKVEEQMPNICLFILAISAEYKSSNLKYTDIEEYKNASLNWDEIYEAFASGGKTSDKESKYEIFSKKYKISNENYHFYESIFHYITGLKKFDIGRFIQEFITEFHLQIGHITPEYEALNVLSYNNLIRLSDQDYEQKTLKIIEFAKSGLYKALDYLTVMHYAERFDNLLQLDLSNILNGLTGGLLKAISDSKLNQDQDLTDFDYRKRYRMGHYSDQLQIKGMKLIADERQKREKEKINVDISSFLDITEAFLEKFLSDADYQYQINKHHS